MQRSFHAAVDHQLRRWREEAESRSGAEDQDGSVKVDSESLISNDAPFGR